MTTNSETTYILFYLLINPVVPILGFLPEFTGWMDFLILCHPQKGNIGMLLQRRAREYLQSNI